MRKTLLFILLLIISKNIFSQTFLPDTVLSGYNYFIGVGIGQSQLNIENSYGTFGRTGSIPRLSIESGIIFRSEQDQHYSIALRFTYQNLYLHPPNSDTHYNDRLSFLDIQLKPMLHLGGKKFMVLLGASIRYPITSKFEVQSLNAQEETEWYPLPNTLKPESLTLVPELGIKIKFDNAQIGFITSFTNGNSFKNTSALSSYSIDEAYYYTLEALIYIPLNL